MIRLAFFDQACRLIEELQAPDFRIAGGVIWQGEHRRVIAHYTQGRWRYRGQHFPRVCAKGRCRLLFGITRDPTAISEAIEHFTLDGPTLRANGVAFAQYDEETDMWQGMMRPTWWQAMRIICEEAAPILTNKVPLPTFNPWDPLHPPLPSSPDVRSTGRLPSFAHVSGAPSPEPTAAPANTGSNPANANTAHGDQNSLNADGPRT